MKNLKKVLAIALALVMVFSFAACGAEKGGDAPHYVCLTESTYPPFDTVDDQGNLIGFDFDLMDAIAEDQGFTVEYVDMAFGSIIPAIQAGQGDIITAGIFVTPEREEQVDFAEPYYSTDTAIVVKEDNDTIKGADDFDNTMKVASQTANMAADMAQAMVDEGKLAEAVILDGFDTCFIQLINGDVDAVFCQSAVANAYQKQQGGVKIVGSVGETKQVAFGVKKGNKELQDKITAGLNNLKENGTYDELVSKWF